MPFTVYILWGYVLDSSAEKEKCHLHFTACGVVYWTLQLKRKNAIYSLHPVGLCIGLFS